MILEDDPYGSIYFEDVTTLADTRPIKADDTDGRVIYLGSFSKIAGARLARRVDGGAAGDRAEGRALQAGRRHLERRLRSAHRAWRAAGGVIDRIAPALRAHYQAKRTVMERALRDASGGPRDVDLAARRLLPVDRIAAASTIARCSIARSSRRSASCIGSAFFVDGGGHDSRAWRSPITPERIDEGVDRLKRALDNSMVMDR